MVKNVKRINGSTLKIHANKKAVAIKASHYKDWKFIDKRIGMETILERIIPTKIQKKLK